MMLSDKDPNGGGRTSRASNMSALSRTSGKTAQRPPSSDFPALVGRGVSSMLRTETELGNVGGVVLDDLSGAGSMHRTLQRHRAPSRMSTASSMSNTSSRASKHFRGYLSSSSAPRHSTGPYGLQHAPNVLSPPMPNAPATASLDGLSNRDRDPQRSRSMTNTMQPPYALSSNRSLTSLRPAHGSHIQNPYVYPSSYGVGLMPLNSNHRPISPALSDSTGIRPRASHRFEEQRLSNGGYGQTYSNTGRTHRKRGQQQGGQGQQYRGLGNPHNVGQMRTRLPSQPSSLSLEDRREEEDSFPPYDSMAYDEQIEGLHSGNPHLRRDRLANRYHDYRSEVPPLPANHRYRIAVEHARFKRPAPGSVSSGSTNLRTDSDVPSSDMTSPPTPKDGVEMMHDRDGTRVVDLNIMSPNKLIVSEEKTSVAYYDYSEQFEHDEYAQPDTRGIPTGFVDRNRTIIEQCVPTSGVAALNSDSFLGQEAQPMSMVVVPPNPNIIANHANVATSMDNPNTAQLANIAELPASPVARRITRDLILRGLEASTTGDTQSLAKSPNTTTDNELTESVDLPVKTHLAADEQVGVFLDSVQNKENRHSILSQAGSSILDSSTLNFAVRHSIPVATRGGFGEEIARGVGSDASMAASPGRSTEDGLSDVLAGYQGNDSKSETDEALRDITGSENNMRAEEHTANSADDDMKPLPLSVRSASNHAHKLSDEQSFKSCTDIPDESSGLALSKSQNVCTTSRSAVNIVREREERPKVSKACSFTTARVPASPDYDAFVPPSRIPSSSLGTMVMNKKKDSSDMSSKQPAPVPRKQLPVPRESSFSTVANKLRPNSKSSVRQSSLSASGSSSTLSITHPSLAVPQRDSSASKEAQRVHAAVSFLMRPLPSRFAKGLRRTDPDGLSTSDETVENAIGSPKDTESCPASRDVSMSLSAADTGKPIEKAPLTPAGVPPKTRVIRVDPPEADNQYNVFVSSPVPVKDQQTPSDTLPIAPEPSSVYSIQDHSASSREEACPDVVPAPSEANRRDSQTTTHLEWHHYVQPVAAPESQQLSMRPSNGVESHLDSLTLAPLTNNQEDSTTDLRLSRYRYPGPSRYLPDLKEESHEDSSLNTSASNLKSSSFRYPFGVPSGIRASGEDPINFSRRSSSMASCRRSGVDSSVGGALGQTHGLPSMRFSRINLFDGLPEDLGLRYSRSMEEVAHVSQRLSRSNPPRPASAGDVKGLQIPLAELEEVERSGLSMQPSTMMSLLAMHGARSPELMAEIERLTIPSVGGLTQRFSEFFPSLREYYKSGESAEFPVEEEIEKHVLEEINEVHPTQKRSSARLRPIRGVSHMVVIDDDLYEEMTNKERKSNSSCIDESVAATDASGAGSTGGESEKGKGVTTTPTHHETTPLSKVQGPSPVFLRPRSHTVNLQVQRHSGESALSSRRSLRSFVSTPTATETRPWNSDKNYPWATSTNPSIDISLPPPTSAKHSPHPGPSHLCNRLSEASSASSFSTAQTATASPFGSPADSTAHARQHPFSSFGRSNDQPHEVGERYPTSALSPPTAIFRDHLSASDTSDDEYYDTTRKTRLSLRKRFSSTHKNTLPNPASTRAGRGKSNQDPAPSESTRPSAISIVQDSVGEVQAFSSSAKVHRHTFRDAEGMRAADYRKQRIIECLKTWWHKSSRLIRHLSIRKDSNTSTI